jgi:hypothetical protein
MTTTQIAQGNGQNATSVRSIPRRSVTLRVAARIAGISYVAIFVLAIFGNFVVREGMVDPDSPAATVANITDSMGVFRLGMIAFLVIFLLDIAVSWALHIIFREVDHDVSLGAAWFRLVYTTLLGAALVFFFQALQLVGDANVASAFTADQVNAQTMVAVDSFNNVWLVGLAAFGVHLVIIGYLLIRSGYVSKVLGYLLIAAGVAYLLDTVAHTLLANYRDYESIFLAMVAIPSMIGEGWLGLWLLLGKRFSSSPPRVTAGSYTP